MKRFYFLVLAALLAVSCKPCCEHVRNELRAPAYPLVTIDPFTCAWSAADRLYDAPVTHWTGVEHHLVGVVKANIRLKQSYLCLKIANSPRRLRDHASSPEPATAGFSSP